MGQLQHSGKANLAEFRAREKATGVFGVYPGA